MRRAPTPRTQPLPEADNFCLAVARHVVGGPESVKVSSVEGQELMVIELSAPPEDVGRLVGRDGRTIGAIRTLAEALAQRIGKRIIVDVQPMVRRG